jgi:four helix bundle protein
MKSGDLVAFDSRVSPVFPLSSSPSSFVLDCFPYRQIEDDDDQTRRASIERRSNEIPRQLTYILIKRYIHSMDPLFDHEKLVVYCVELGFVAWIAAFLDDASKSAGRHRRELIEQLDRASLSVLLNTAEGNGKRQGRHRAKFFDDARGSALECAACLDAAVAKGLVSADRVCPGKQMLARVVAMLSSLDRSLQHVGPSSRFPQHQSFVVVLGLLVKK